MKRIKYIVSFFLILLCLILSGELYQNHLESFTNGLYYFISADNDKSQFSDIQSICEKNDCEAFCFKRETENMLSTSITVYSAEKTVERIKKECSIDSGEYKSFFSGSTTLTFEDFMSAPPEETTFFIFGSEDDIKEVRNAFCDLHGGGWYHKDDKESAQWLLLVLWIIFAILFLLLTWFDIQFQKKENFILVSLGKSVWSLIFKNILKDTAFLCILYSVLTFLLNKKTYVMYKQKESLLILAGVVVINMLLYFTMHRYDLKKALSSSNFSNAVLSNCYVIKAIALIVTVLVLSTNVLLIADNAKMLMQYDKISEYNDYQFMDLYCDLKTDDEYELEKLEEKVSSVKKEIFYELYKENNVAFSVSMRSGDDCKYLLVDKNAMNLISGISEVENIDLTKDYYILIPDKINKEDAESVADDVFKFLFDEIGDICTHETLSYKGTHNIAYFENKDSVLSGFETTVNPVIILCNVSDAAIDTALKESKFYDGFELNDVMFRFTQEDTDSWSERFDFEKNGFKIASTSVTAKADYVESATERIVLLNTVISIFMLLLEFMIMTTTVKLEYTANAMTVSLKKILGYSIFSRNKAVLGLNLFSVFIAAFTSVMISVTARMEIWKTSLVIGLIILIAEAFIISYYVLKMDKSSVAKILKGGCL